MVTLALTGLMSLALVAAAQAAVWNRGDVFVAPADNSGNYNVYDNSGHFKQTVNTGQSAPTGEVASAGCALNSSGNLWSATFHAGKVVELSGTDPHGVLKTIDSSPRSTGGASPESLSFDSAGDFYVGHADGTHVINKFNSAGGFLASFTVARDQRGSDWTEIASDQHTLFYTSEGSRVLRFDTTTKKQRSDFATNLPGRFAYAHRLLSPGDGSGGMLVADSQGILRLDASGHIVKTYTISGENNLFALNLDPNGTSFWTGDLTTGNFYRLNINTGAIEVGPIAASASGVAGICVKGEVTAATKPKPQCVVPNLHHRTLAQAESLLRSRHCALGKVTRPKGNQARLVVVSQSPRSGSRRGNGTRVSLGLGHLARHGRRRHSIPPRFTG